MAAKISIVLLLFVMVFSRAAAQPPAGDAKARAALEAVLAKVTGTQSGKRMAVAGEDLTRVFPKQHLFAVRFRTYPVKPPDSFKASNLFAVAADGTVTRLVNEKALKEYFHAFALAANSDADAKAVLRAWLRLAEELHQDGYFGFELVPDSVDVRACNGVRVASGRVRVIDGGEGQIRSTLSFDGQGKLTDASTEATLKAGGARPLSGRP